jgi:hypothetical protein
MGWLNTIRAKVSQGLEAIRELPSQGAELFRERRKLVVICLGAMVIFLILGIAAILLFRVPNPRAGGSQDLSEAFSPRAIPQEELFLPDEPDFLPEVILERERREAWTAEDARPFWTDPLEEGADVYLDMMGTVIDELLERVP